MASSSPSILSSLILFLFIVLSITQVTLAGRHVPPRNAKAKFMAHDHVKQPKSTTTFGQEGAASTDVKQPQTFFGHEGSVLIPGFGRFMFNPNYNPRVVGLGTDHSFGAAINSQYLPGNDDTFIPNPGFEIPNPVHFPVFPQSSTAP
ncbi:hypothetical protein QJS04_geneDACA011798 [Acorus gramineus]|uniref:Uncharacterized protein n=1 Tax=Acorus gramineus TaxID=55184 RepID=A0AAV9BFH9_ACOGR|nr:hypothetical protein QJS04_geneDACA011798 [Acorus gramineus]